MVAGQQNKKVVFIIQARMQSTRLPGKILLPMPIDGKFTILDQIIKTLKTSKVNSQIYIATSVNEENDVLDYSAISNGVQIFRGSENDVLSRFIGILETENYHTVVRLTADNPIVDIDLLDQTIENHINSKKDYTNTTGLPLGMNFEVIAAKALLSLKEKKLLPTDKEHVTTYIKNSKEYSCQTSIINSAKKLENIRVTIDYPTDYLVVSSLYSLYLKTKITMGTKIIEYAYENYPFLLKCNQSNVQKAIYTTVEEEMQVAIPILEELEFSKIVNLLKTNK